MKINCQNTSQRVQNRQLLQNGCYCDQQGFDQCIICVKTKNNYKDQIDIFLNVQQSNNDRIKLNYEDQDIFFNYKMLQDCDERKNCQKESNFCKSNNLLKDNYCQKKIQKHYAMNSDDQQNQNYIKHLPQNQVKSKVYSKNYRQKKKQQLKVLQQQNRFLKNKIQDLTLRLRQLQIYINKIKHNGKSQTSTFHSTKQKLLKQMHEMINSQSKKSAQQILAFGKKMKDLNAFNNKQKLDLLNYYMNQILENLIDDFGIYFVDSMISKKGLWRENQNTKLRLIDYQIMQLHQFKDLQKAQYFLNSMPSFMLNQMKNFKDLWIKLYKDYTNILQKGILLQNMFYSIEQKFVKSQKQVINNLKIYIYFQNNKYKKDIRQVRQQWFKQYDQQKCSFLNQRKINQNRKKGIKMG